MLENKELINLGSFVKKFVKIILKNNIVFGFDYLEDSAMVKIIFVG